MIGMLGKIIDGQYRRPSGLLGRYIGNRMAVDHYPENLWTVSILQSKATDWILECGFGAGVAIQELARVVTQGRIVGIDFSETMVDAARKRNAVAVKRGIVQLHYGDVSTMPFGDDTFDKVFSIHSIYFWPKPGEALRQIWRVLKLGGMVLLTILPKDKWNPANPDALVGTAECKPYSGNELVHMLTEAGFSKTQVVSDEHSEVPSKYCVIGLKVNDRVTG
ncbi:MAG: class I SAM-dependent methyltransferase [Chloroflexi bacterium]|nr:class I SAM-dependent methyltransferase [Chloroflexota bacterium]